MLFPKYSFVQDGATAYPDCYPDQQPCIPTSSPHKLAFQVTIVVPDTDIFAFAYAANYLAAVPVDFECNPEFSPIVPLNHLVLMSPGAYLVTDDGASNYYVTMWFDTWNNDYATATAANNVIAMPVGTCFKFAVISDQYTEGLLSKRTYYGCTNCFTVVPSDECYLSQLSYSNTDDAFGFDYADAPAGYMNKIELPIYLRDPKMESDQKVYTRSDGSILKVYERKEETYQLETDQMPYTWHKALDIALSHDNVIITNGNAASFDPLNTATVFVKKDAYEIEYNKAPYSAFGKGKCQLSNAAAVSLINNNCG